MKKLLLLLGLALSWVTPAAAQAPCGGVNFTPQAGVTCLQEPTVSSYTAASLALVPASSATDLACIQGAAGIVIRVQQIRLSGTAATQIVVPAIVYKRASLDTGGTPATGTALPVAYALDSNNGTAKATFNAWTANPTIVDSSPGIVDIGDWVLSKTDGTNGAVAPYTLFDWFERNFSQAPILRTAAQALCVNINSTSPSTGAANIVFKWTEAAQ